MTISGLCFVYIMQYVCPDLGSNPGPLDCKSEALPTELRGPLGIIQLKNVYKIYHVSNCVIMMINVISHLFKLLFTPKKPRLSLEQCLRNEINSSMIWNHQNAF